MPYLAVPHPASTHLTVPHQPPPNRIEPCHTTPNPATPSLTGPYHATPNPAQPDRATAHFLWRILLFMLTPFVVLQSMPHPAKPRRTRPDRTRPNLAIPHQAVPRQAAPHWHIANLIVHVSPLDIFIHTSPDRTSPIPAKPGHTSPFHALRRPETRFKGIKKEKVGIYPPQVITSVTRRASPHWSCASRPIIVLVYSPVVICGQSHVGLAALGFRISNIAAEQRSGADQGELCKTLAG